MAILDVTGRMVYWDVKLGIGNSITALAKNVLAGFSVKYQVNEPTEANLVIRSQSYIEDIFTENQVVEISAGYERAKLISMFKGKIRKLPSGDAQEQLSYTVEAVGNESSMALIAKNKIYVGYTKAAIVASILSLNGIVPVIQIADVVPLKAKYTPVQGNKTDYEFLMECAARWDCLMWFSDLPGVLTCYFIDKDKAHTLGNVQRLRNPKDLFTHYILGYRTNATYNNVAKLSWKFKAPKGGGDGSPTYKAANETGKKEAKRMYTITYKGERWRIKPQFFSAGNKDWKNFYKYAAAISSSGPAGFETKLRYYFEKVTVDSKTNAFNHPSGERCVISVELNEGDPWLRAPRSAKLEHGTEDPRAVSAYLPRFLWGRNKDTDFKVNMVETSLSDKGLVTKLEMYKG